MTMPNASLRRTQSGIALIAVLVILMIVTLLAVSASRNASQGEMLARSSRAQQIALQAAEAALSDARADIRMKGKATGAGGQETRNLAIQQGTVPSDCTILKGICAFNPFASSNHWDNVVDAEWAERGEFAMVDGTNTAFKLATGGSVAGVAKQPRYLIEAFPGTGASGEIPQGQKQVQMFRITARGYGPTADTVVWLQETVQKLTTDQQSY